MRILEFPIYVWLDAAKIYVLLFLIFGLQKKLRPAGFVVLAAGSVLIGVLAYARGLQDYLFMLEVVFASLGLILFLTNWRHILFVPLAVIGIGIVEGVAGNAVFALMGRDINLFRQERLLTMLISVVSLLVLILLACAKLLTKRQRELKPSKQLLGNLWLILLGMIGLALYVAPIQMIALTSSDKTRVLLGVTLSSILFFAISIVSLINQRRKEDYRRESEAYATFLAQQKEYYASLMDKETEMRRFRHDIDAHLAFLGGLLAEGRTQEAVGYLNDLTGFVDSASPDFNTGNEAVNIVLAQEMRQHPDVEVVWRGMLPAGLCLTDLELCVLFSNLFKNAAEATEASAQDKIIQAQAKSLGSTLIITIENPADSEVRFLRGRPITSKDDASLHGFGTANIERVASKYNGSAKYEHEQKRFLAEVILPDCIK